MQFEVIPGIVSHRACTSYMHVLHVEELGCLGVGYIAGCTLYWHVRTHTVLMCVLHFACVGVHEYSFTLPLA